MDELGGADAPLAIEDCFEPRFAENVSGRVERLGDAVGEHEQRVAGSEHGFGDGVRAVGVDAERDAGRFQQVAAAAGAQQIGRVVAGIAVAQPAGFEIEHAGEHRHKHAGGVAGREQPVGVAHALRHIGLRGGVAHDGARHRHKERGWDALSRNIGDRHHQAALVEHKIIVEIAADLARRVHIGVQVDPVFGGAERQRTGQDRLLDRGSRLHLLAARLLRLDLRGHIGKSARECRERPRLPRQFGEHGGVVLSARQGIRRVGQEGERLVGAVEALPQLADDLDRDRGKLGDEAHQVVAVDTQCRDIGARHDRRRARHIGNPAELADDTVAPERRHMDEPGGDLDKDIDLAVEDHQREVAMLALLHDLLASRESDGAATRGDGVQRARIEAREDRVQRQHPGDLLDRGCWRRCRRRVLLPRRHAAISTTAARVRQTGLVPGRTSGSASLIPTAAAGGAKLLSALKEPPLDPRPLPGLCVIEALLRLANSLTQIAAALPITLHRQDVRGRRLAFRNDRPGLSGKRNAQRGRDQKSGENPGFQHDPPLVRIDLVMATTLGAKRSFHRRR